MASVLLVLATGAAIVWLVPAIAELTCLIRAWHLQRAAVSTLEQHEEPWRLRVLVPAHNEELLIGGLLQSLEAAGAMNANITVCVVADRCGDSTVEIARRRGVEVVSYDGLESGKGAALRWAIALTDLRVYDAIVVIDCDTLVDEAFFTALSRIPDLPETAVQCYQGLRNPGDSWLTELGALYGVGRYELQIRLRQLAGLNAPLCGNGMVFGTQLLRRHGFAPRTAKEDLEYTIRYTLVGERIRFAPTARLFTQEPRTLHQAGSQRERWQAGKFHLLRVHLVAVLRSSLGFAEKINLLAEMFPLSPVPHAVVALGAVAVLSALNGNAATFLATAFLASMLPVFCTTIVGLTRHPNPIRASAALACLPFYGLWRLLVVLRGLSASPTKWQRTTRHS